MKKPCWNCGRLNKDYQDENGEWMCEPCYKKFDLKLGKGWCKGVFRR